MEGLPKKNENEPTGAFAVNGSFETGFTIQEIDSSEEEMKKNQFTFETPEEAQEFIKEIEKELPEEKEGM